MRLWLENIEDNIAHSIDDSIEKEGVKTAIVAVGVDMYRGVCVCCNGLPSECKAAG